MSYTNINEPSNSRRIFLGLLISMSVAAVVSLLAWGLPRYRLYRQDLAGQANLRQQEWEKKIAIEQAKAEKESSVLKAEAEIERAKGAARANEIIAGSLQGNEAYLRYLWIDKMTDNQNLIYVPTEAGLPLLEANRIK